MIFLNDCFIFWKKFWSKEDLLACQVLKIALYVNRALVGTSAYWSVCVTTNFPQLLLAFALHLPHSHPHPIVGLTLSLGAEFWEHFSM